MLFMILQTTLYKLIFFTCVDLFPVTLARAIELKHSASLIAALANETGQLYKKAGMCVMVSLWM